MTLHKSGEEFRTRLVNAFEEFVNQNGYNPTVRDLCSLLGVTSTGHMRHHIKILERKGDIRIVPGIARGMFLKKK